MTTTTAPDTDKLRDDVNDARGRVTRIAEALKAAREEYAAKRDEHAHAALLAEFDAKKAEAKTRLESEVSAARARVRDLEGAQKAAEAEVANAQEALRRAIAGDAMARAEAAIRERESAMSEAARLIGKLGAQIERAEAAGLEARRAACEFSAGERESVATSAVEPGVVRSVVEALMWRAGLRWLTDRTALADADDPLAAVRRGHEGKLRRWRDDVPSQEGA